MKRLLPITALVALMVSDAAAQHKFSFDFRGTVDAPASRLADADLSTGVGFGATLGFRIQRHVTMYGGWDWLHFSANQSFAGANRDFEETGYTLGLRFQHPFEDGGRLDWRAEAGATYKHVEIENSGGDLISNSGHEVGVEGGLGLAIPSSGGWSLTPMLRYRALAPDFTIGATRTSAHLRYFGVEIGVARSF